MYSVYRAILLVHVAFGFLGLVAFWFPIFSPKGGRVHVRAGNAFLWSAYVVATTAFVIALMDVFVPFAVHPEDLPSNSAEFSETAAAIRLIGVFLGYLAVITLASVHHGVRAMQHKRAPERLRTPFHTAINTLAIVAGAGVLVLAIVSRELVFALLSPIGLLIGPQNLRYARRAPRQRMSYWYEHMGGMIGAGIAFHTAFAVFGGARLFGLGLEGPWAFVPWILPSVIGIPAITIWTRHYQRKFGDLRQREPAATT